MRFHSDLELDSLVQDLNIKGGQCPVRKIKRNHCVSRRLQKKKDVVSSFLFSK